ncbi:MAG: 7-carboxy-7-deazaguanine synthase QueE [Planctomycetota bacterium]
MQNLKISELFTSIQGESSYAGLPCTFIRLAGCNLKCSWCDSTYSRSDEDSKIFSVEELVSFACKANTELICITGGEPLLQQNVYTLMNSLYEKGFTILLETNGSVDISSVPEFIVTILDVKTPSSGMSEQFNLNNIKSIKSIDQIKFVIADKNDFTWSKIFIESNKLIGKAEIIFSPLFDRIPYAELASLIVEENLQVRMQLQLHKIIWPEVERGV